MEKVARDNSAMQGIVHTFRKLSADEYERRVALQRDIDEMDRRAEREYELKMVREQGLTEGRMEGETLAKQEDARRMKRKGYSADAIVDITGLSAEEIAAL